MCAVQCGPAMKSVVQGCEHFDMSVSDAVGAWTLSPEVACSLAEGSSIRAITHDAGGVEQEIILDSGADHSALPLSFAGVGTPVEAPNQAFVDAQGNPLPVQQVRMAEVVIGDVCFREFFIIAPVSSPLLCLGRLYRAGWEVRRHEQDLVLGCGDHAIPVDFRRNSLAVQGMIRCVEQTAAAAETRTPPAIRALIVTLLPVLSSVPCDGRLVKLSDRCCAMHGFSTSYVNTTLFPLHELLWRRTTLVLRKDQSWQLLEFGEDVAKLESLDELLPDPETIESVITIAHDHILSPDELGFNYVTSDPPPQPLSVDVEVHEPNEPPRDHDAADDDRAVPADDQAEAPLERRLMPLGDEEVEVNGARLSSTSTLRALRAGCKALGLGTKGSKKQCFERLKKHIQEHALLVENEAHAAALEDSTRHPRTASIPQTPSPAEIEQHNVTHMPYKNWCELCVRFKGRQDQHRDQDHMGTTETVVSLDYGFCTHEEQDAELLTVLVIHDRHTKSFHAVPTKSKAGQSMSYLVTELVRFVSFLGHREVCFRSDDERPLLALVESAKRACRHLGIKARSQSSPVEDHEANGAVEQAWKQIRSHAGILVV